MKSMKILTYTVVMTAVTSLLVMSATPCFGQASATGKIGGHGYVDLGLSVKWADCNIGAETPSDYGNYYAWGETAAKTTYTKKNNTTSKVELGDIAGDGNYDAARANWGETWRLPTKAEIDELLDKCDWEKDEQNGNKGYKVTGPNGNSIFLPFAGAFLKKKLVFAKIRGEYWSATPSGSTKSYCLSLALASKGSPKEYRYAGANVRPVTD